MTEFVTELGRRLTLVSGDGRETFYLRQRLSIAIQRGNAIACLGSLLDNLLTPDIPLTLTIITSTTIYENRTIVMFMNVNLYTSLFHYILLLDRTGPTVYVINMKQ